MGNGRKKLDGSQDSDKTDMKLRRFLHCFHIHNISLRPLRFQSRSVGTTVSRQSAPTSPALMSTVWLLPVLCVGWVKNLRFFHLEPPQKLDGYLAIQRIRTPSPLSPNLSAIAASEPPRIACRLKVLPGDAFRGGWCGWCRGARRLWRKAPTFSHSNFTR